MNVWEKSEINREHLGKVVASSTTRERDPGGYRRRQKQLEVLLDIFSEGCKCADRSSCA